MSTGKARTRRTRLTTAIIVVSTLLHLPVSWNLIGKAHILSPNAPGIASLPGETLAIACLPVLIGAVLAVWSLRTRHRRIALGVALAVADTVAVSHAYHFSVVVPEIRTASR